MGISPETLSRRLRRELSAEEKEQMMQAIREVNHER